jgi:erythromycin esterase-like protein
VEEPFLTPVEAARLLGISKDEADDLARPDGCIPLETIRERLDSTVLELARGLAHAREEIGRLSGQLKEVRAMNMRLQKEARESIEERRRLTEEVLELRAAAEERLMLMERIEHIARVEQTLAESEAELERLRRRGPLARLLDRR